MQTVPTVVPPTAGYPSHAPAPAPLAPPVIAPAAPLDRRIAPSTQEPFYTPRVPRGSPVRSAAAGGTGPGAFPAETVAAVARPAKLAPRRRALGLGIDLGAPDGVTLGLVVAPAAWMRLHAAFGTNTAGLGYRGGVTFVPVGFGPSFTFEAGHCNMAETNELIRMMFSAPKWAKPYVQAVGYTYLNGHVGFDYVRRNLTVFLHGGYTYLMGTVSSSQPVVVDSNSKTTATIGQDGRVAAHAVSAKLGMVYMFGGS